MAAIVWWETFYKLQEGFAGVMRNLEITGERWLGIALFRTAFLGILPTIRIHVVINRVFSAPSQSQSRGQSQGQGLI